METVARLTLQPFFALVELGDFEAARNAILEIQRLVRPSNSLHSVFLRIYHEKVAFSFQMEGDHRAAIEEYSKASEYHRCGERGELKVRGGKALSGYLLLEGSDSDQLDSLAKPFLDEMRTVRDQADKAKYPDVVESSSCNLSVMQASQFDGWCSFELT